MTRWERCWLNLTAGLVSATGVIYLWMKYGLQSNDPFSVINHPWQPFILNLHILVAPLLILGIGMIVNSHVVKKLRNGHRRNGGKHHTNQRSPRNRLEGLRTGLIALFAFLIMVFSGYLLQIATNETMLRVALIVHLTSGIIFAVGYAIHLLVGIRLRNAKTVSREEPRLAA